MEPRFRSRAKLFSAILALPLAITLAACGTTAAPDGGTAKPDAPTPPAAQVKDELVIGAVYEHEGFDPLNPVSASANGERLVPVFDTLLRVNTSGDIAPQLAESMESEDGNVWVLKLRSGVNFTDGTPLDADAVIYNIERHRAPDTPSSSKFLLSTLEAIEATDASTVTFTLSETNWSFPYLFTPSGALGLIGSKTALEADATGFNAAPIGAGPYIVSEWVPDDHVTMVANPDYWGGEPAIKTLTYKVLPDPQSRETALKSGQIDLTSISSNLEALSSDDSLRFYTEGNRGALSLLPNTSVAPFDDLRVRQAVQIAIDPVNTRQVLFGQSDLWDGERGCTPFSSSAPQCEESTVKTNVEKAKELIAAYAAEGKSVDVELLATTALPTQAQYIDQVLKEIGLNSSIRSVGPGEHIPALYGGDFQISFWQMVPFDSFYPLGYTIFSGNSRNVIQQSDDAFNAAIEQGANAATAAERNAGFQEMQRIWNDQAFAVWLSPLPQYIVSQANVDLGPDYLGGFAFYPAEISFTE